MKKLIVLCALLGAFVFPAIAETPAFDVAGDRALSYMGPIPVQGELIDYANAPWSTPDLRSTYWRFGYLELSPDLAVLEWAMQTSRGLRQGIDLAEPVIQLPWSEDFGAYVALVPHAGSYGLSHVVILQIDFEHPDGPRAYLYRGVLRTIGHYPWYEWSNDWLWQKELIAPQTLEPHYAGPSRRTPSE